MAEPQVNPTDRNIETLYRQLTLCRQFLYSLRDKHPNLSPTIIDFLKRLDAEPTKE